jgi:hypothetical protein
MFPSFELLCMAFHQKIIWKHWIWYEPGNRFFIQCFVDLGVLSFAGLVYSSNNERMLTIKQLLSGLHLTFRICCQNLFRSPSNLVSSNACTRKAVRKGLTSKESVSAPYFTFTEFLDLALHHLWFRHFGQWILITFPSKYLKSKVLWVWAVQGIGSLLSWPDRSHPGHISSLEHHQLYLDCIVFVLLYLLFAPCWNVKEHIKCQCLHGNNRLLVQVIQIRQVSSYWPKGSFKDSRIAVF